jgi:hypothetical protein
VSHRLRITPWGACNVVRDSGRRCRRPADHAYRMRIDVVMAPHFDTSEAHHDEYVVVNACRPCAERLGYETPRRKR